MPSRSAVALHQHPAVSQSTASSAGALGEPRGAGAEPMGAVTCLQQHCLSQSAHCTSQKPSWKLKSHHLLLETHSLTSAND